MKLRDLLSFGAFGLMIVVGLAYVGSLGIRTGHPVDRTDVSMTVVDVNNLVVGSNVMLRGVPVGKVREISTGVDGATVDFYFGDRYRIPVDSDVRLENLSALGESYISMEPRTDEGPIIHSGHHITADAVTQPPSISELATSTVRVLNQLDPGSLQRIITEADTALPDPTAVLPNLSTTSILLRNTVQGMEGRGQLLLDNFQVLLGNAGWLGPLLTELTPGVQEMSVHVQSLFSGFPALVDSDAPNVLYGFGAFLRRIQALLDSNGGDLKVIGDAIQPKMGGIAGALLNFDSGQILTNVLANLPEDGALPIHVSIPAR